jgi:FG-GAP-like repeat/FlgD Ig-like domain
MKKTLFVLLLLLGATSLFAQATSKAFFNRSAQDQTDELRPWAEGGVRSVLAVGDLDKDGKPEILATDYSNGGRVHVLEYVDDETLELVWSSPVDLERANGSTPRWVQAGDLDADGNMEIIFSVNPRYTGNVMVYENVGDNDFGTESIIDFPAELLVSSGIGAFRMDRERGTVYDFDGDGQDELILSNQDNNLYILSINGNAPGFASWVVEGGDPVTAATSTVTAGPNYQAIPADIDGDDKIEIVIHNWNFYGMFSIDPNGANSYTYPLTPNTGGGVAGPSYFEFYKNRNIDGVALMGATVADVDGDGKDEIASTIYPDYNVTLISQPQGAEGVYVWDDSTKFSVLKTIDEVSLRGTKGEVWGCYGMDFNRNGKEEILVGGFYGENIIAVEYNGSGDILDGANYDVSTYYKGESEINTDWEQITISDSAGIIDTSYPMGVWESQSVMKMSQGDFIGQDGVDELVIGYQGGRSGKSFYDSIKVVGRTWADTSWIETEEMVYNDRNIQIRVLQYGTGTGIKSINMNVVSPTDYVLAQNYPNPFNPTTNIRFSLPISKKISVIVYDMLGSEVKTLVNNQEFAKGSYEATWDGTNNFGSKVASGNYIVTMKFGNFNKSIKMQLLK